MKIFGHPIHPVFIHFPTALLPMDLVLNVLSLVKNDPSFALAGFYCLAGGVLTGFLAMLTGLVDILSIPKTNKIALAAGIYHGFINGLVIIIFSVIAYKEWTIYPSQISVTTASIVIRGILVCTLFVGNFLGGKLIYKYHIGIINIK
jgi:uncharacterized membrane protein